MVRLLLVGGALFVTPALSFLARNLDHYPLEILWPGAGLSIALGGSLLGLVCVVGYMTRPGACAVVYVALAAFWFLQFWYREIIDSLEGALAPRDAPVVVAVLLMTAAISLAALARRPAVQRAILLFLALNLLLVCSSEYLSARPNRSDVENFPRQAPPLSSFRPVISRDANIYYVIVDGLGSERALRQHLGIDVRASVHRLEANHDFHVVPNARSSYNATYLTLASIFQQGYLVEDNSPRYHDRSRFFPSLLNHPEQVRLFSNLEKLGYLFTHVGNSWGPCRSRAKVRCLSDHGANSTFAAELMGNYALQSFSSGSLLEHFYLQSTAPVASRSLNDNDALNTFMKWVQRQPRLLDKGRNFFFIHHMNPHPPARDSECRLLEGGNYTKEDLVGYRTSVECAFRRMEQFAELIARIDPDGIVVLQADHGSGVGYSVKATFDEITPEQLDGRFAIFNALKLPEDCRSGLHDDLGNVGTIDLVLGCAGGVLPEPQQPRSYAGFVEGHPEFGKVRQVYPDGSHAGAQSK